MTGYGGVSLHENGVTVFVEIKTVNNRYLKVSQRISESYGILESRIENLIRETLRRGSVNIFVRISLEKTGADFSINKEVLKQYINQIREAEEELGINTMSQPGQLAGQAVLLPGVTQESVASEDRAESVWPFVERAVVAAIKKLDGMRLAEGESMAVDLIENCRLLMKCIQEVETFAPEVVEQYRLRLTERVERIMTESQLTLDPADLIREAALFADKSDISEEIVRFKSHLKQFDDTIKKDNSQEGCGRKLDFLTQELFRETNTIGSKANDAKITNRVVEMKTIIERIREMVQNVE
jgi:uncharacterized protein (TIGR00255 family)